MRLKRYCNLALRSSMKISASSSIVIRFSKKSSDYMQSLLAQHGKMKKKSFLMAIEYQLVAIYWLVCVMFV